MDDDYHGLRDEKEAKKSYGFYFWEALVDEFFKSFFFSYTNNSLPPLIMVRDVESKHRSRLYWVKFFSLFLFRFNMVRRLFIAFDDEM